MSEYISITDSGSSNNDIKAIGSSNNIGQISLRDQNMGFVAGAIKYWAIPGALPLTDSERQFEEQKRLFNQIAPLFLAPYRGLFVISRNGEIVDAHEDMDVLIRRFFSENGDVPIYLEKIGGQIREVIDTHF